MRPEESSGAGAKASAIVFLACLLAGGYYVFTKAASGPEAARSAALMAPESALKLYLRTAYKFMHEEGGVTLKDVEPCVTKEDWDWYNTNYGHIFGDALRLKSAANPTEVKALGRIMAMRELLEYGPNREDCPIVNRQIGLDKCVFTLRKHLNDAGDYRDMDVALVKKGKYWKVEDFAGGRSFLSGGRPAPKPVKP